jgi:pimeloyl-ACP methyl ester carboxylesterase
MPPKLFTPEQIFYTLREAQILIERWRKEYDHHRPHSPTWSIDPNLSPELLGNIERIWENQQNDLASLSSNSTHVIATKAGHYIQVDEPQLVIDAILKVIDEAKK